MCRSDRNSRRKQRRTLVCVASAAPILQPYVTSTRLRWLMLPSSGRAAPQLATLGSLLNSPPAAVCSRRQAVALSTSTPQDKVHGPKRAQAPTRQATDGRATATHCEGPNPRPIRQNAATAKLVGVGDGLHRVAPLRGATASGARAGGAPARSPPPPRHPAAQREAACPRGGRRPVPDWRRPGRPERWSLRPGAAPVP